MRRVIAMRKNFKAFSRGSMEFLLPENPKVLTFLRQFEDETILVVVNLSRFAQPAELDLSRFAGSALMEVFSQNYFPPIKAAPYPITLGPHAHYWFLVRPQTAAARASDKRVVPTIRIDPNIETLLVNEQRLLFEREILPDYIRTCRWFGAKARTIRALRIAEEVAISAEANAARIWFLEVSYLEGPTENYALPVQITAGAAASQILRSAPQAVIARFSRDARFVLQDAVWDKRFREELFRTVTTQQCLKGRGGELCGIAGSVLNEEETSGLDSQVLSAEQSNSSMLFGNNFFVKLYRKLEDGVNPDVEITRFLTERCKFPHVPEFAGAIEYRRKKSEPTVACLVQRAVQNEGDAWELTLDTVGSYYERVLAQKAELQSADTPAGMVFDDLIGGIYPEKAKLLARRTGELHQALASDSDDPAFAPEPFNAMAQRSVYQNMRASLRRAFALLQKRVPDLPENFRDEAQEVLAAEKEILAEEQRILEQRSGAAKIRIHGDYHLGQALYTGKDFIILDFEGEPARPLSERKLKRSALRDVTGMMRSFQYAAYSALWQPSMRPEDIPFLERWADLWYREISSMFLQSYLTTTAGAVFIPEDPSELQIFLKAYLLDKAVYEIGYELNHRPSWVVIPIRGIKHIMKSA
jgi:maltose alpha-D-glucosyltransferase/alpha-amylase